MTKLHPDLEALMPEPFAMMHDDGYWTMKPGTEPHESRYAGWRKEVFTADQVREAILAATERAAKQVPTNWLDSMFTGPDAVPGIDKADARTIEMLLRRVAAAIRSGGEGGL